jgi:hypothetical protein
LRVDREFFGARGETERCFRERGVWCVDEQLCRWDRAREGRFASEITGAIERAEQHLNQVQRAAGLKAVRVRADATHGVEGDGAADDFVVLVAVDVGPNAIEFDGFVEGDVGDLGRHAFDLVGGDAAAFGDGFGGVVFACVAFEN